MPRPRPAPRFCAQVSIETSSIQYESDNMMNQIYGSDYGGRRLLGCAALPCALPAGLLWAVLLRCL